MEKVWRIYLYMVLPTLVAYSGFFLIYNTFKVYLGGYQWLAAISFGIVTVYIIMANKKEWKVIKEQR